MGFDADTEGEVSQTGWAGALDGVQEAGEGGFSVHAYVTGHRDVCEGSADAPEDTDHGSGCFVEGVVKCGGVFAFQLDSQLFDRGQGVL